MDSKIKKMTSKTVLACAALVAFSSCSKPPPKVVELAKAELTLQSARGNRKFDDKDRVIKKFDMNRDGDPDIWKVYRRIPGGDGKPIEVLERVELDLNFDRRIDLWRFYNERGELVREEMDLDFDGRIDVAVLYESGKIVTKEYSQGYEEQVRVWKNYENGELVRISRITKQGSKVPDTFEMYEKGDLAAIGYDRDGDGKPDVWEKATDKRKPAADPSVLGGDGGLGAGAAPTTAAANPAPIGDGGIPPTSPVPPPMPTPSPVPESGDGGASTTPGAPPDLGGGVKSVFVGPTGPTPAPVTPPAPGSEPVNPPLPR